MNISIILVLIAVLILSILWFITELKTTNKLLRRSLGILAILSSFGLAWTSAKIVRLNYNAWYGLASKRLIDSVVEELENNEIKALLKEMKSLQQDFKPTYESKAHYDALVNEAVKRIKENTTGKLSKELKTEQN